MTEPSAPRNSFSFSAASGADWGDCAMEYEHFSANIGFYRDITEMLLELLPVPLMSVVDFGCGGGRFTRALLARTTSGHTPPKVVHLVDCHESMLALTTSLQHPGVTFARVSAEEDLADLPERLGPSIDVVVCNSSLHLCREPETLVHRAAALLRPGGRLVANIPDQDFDFGDGWTSEFAREALRS